MDPNARKRLEARSLSDEFGYTLDETGFVIWALTAFVSLCYQVVQYVLLLYSSNFAYDIVVVGSECNDNLTVSDSQSPGKTCAWYDIGTNSDQCGAFDYPEETSTTTDANGVTTVELIPGFIANETCCSCGKPDDDITEAQYNKANSEYYGKILFFYITGNAVLTTIMASYLYS